MKKKRVQLSQTQEEAVQDVLKDLKEADAEGAGLRKRLVYGDVGSGKTLVIAESCLRLLRTEEGTLAAVMCPTTALAEQVYRAIRDQMTGPERKGALPAVLITARTGSGDRDRCSAAECRLVVGTHALAFCLIRREGFRLLFIDEQQKFGVGIRQAVTDKMDERRGRVVALTTATPIPRTIGQTIAGEIEVSCILAEHHNRLRNGKCKTPKRPKVLEDARDAATKAEVMRAIYRTLDRAEGGIYLICPCIDNNNNDDDEDNSAIMSCGEVLETYLPRKIANGDAVGVLHGKMDKREQLTQLDRFREGKTRILVTTTIVEVGVDVPQAELAVIFNAERFGAAQLHQLTGRVGRSLSNRSRSTCYVIAAPGKTRDVRERIRGGTGLEKALLDAQRRGPGDLFDTEQKGYDLPKGDGNVDVDKTKLTI